MIQSRILQGAKVSDTGVPELVITAINPGTPAEKLDLEIMHRPEAIGNENVAYLVFGVPGTSSYSFMDLNNLPGDIKVCVTIARGDTCVSKSEFASNLGNTPQAV